MHKLYLDPFMDMFNGEIISYGIDKRPSAANVMNALNEAIEVTSDCPFLKELSLRSRMGISDESLFT